VNAQHEAEAHRRAPVLSRAEEALYDPPVLRRFAGVDLGQSPAPLYLHRRRLARLAA